MMRRKAWTCLAATAAAGAAILSAHPAPLHARPFNAAARADRCTYFMCEYEKSNIDSIILEHAGTCQTVMFGEIHDTALAGAPAPVRDSIYVQTLLARLKQLGYTYLALEADRNAPAGSHSYDVIRFCRTYRTGQPLPGNGFSHAKPGWIDLAARAIDLGYAIRFIDAGRQGGFGNMARDQAMFETIKQEIFDEHPDARVIVYIGAFHIGEQETGSGIFTDMEKTKPLGLLLDRYTKGNNFSVYMGHTHDTPVGCDLFISYFIWGSDR